MNFKCLYCREIIKTGEKYCTKCNKKINWFYHFLIAFLYSIAILTTLFIILIISSSPDDKFTLLPLLLFNAPMYPFTYRFLKKYITKLNIPKYALLSILVFICSTIFTALIGMSDDIITAKSQQQEETLNKDLSYDESDIKIDENIEQAESNNPNINYNYTIYKDLMNLGFTLEEAMQTQDIFLQVGIESLTDIHSGHVNPDINALVSYVAYANNDKNLKFYFTIEKRKLFYIGFTGEDLYDSAKGGVLKKITDVHIPDTEVSTSEFAQLQVYAEDVIVRFLSYPETAKFPLYDGWGCSKEDNKYKVWGYVTSCNAYGVRIKTIFEVFFVMNDTKLSVDAVTLNGTRVK